MREKGSEMISRDEKADCARGNEKRLEEKKGK